MIRKILRTDTLQSIETDYVETLFLQYKICIIVNCCFVETGILFSCRRLASSTQWQWQWHTSNHSHSDADTAATLLLLTLYLCLKKDTKQKSDKMLRSCWNFQIKNKDAQEVLRSLELFSLRDILSPLNLDSPLALLSFMDLLCSQQGRS